MLCVHTVPCEGVGTLCDTDLPRGPGRRETPFSSFCIWQGENVGMTHVRKCTFVHKPAPKGLCVSCVDMSKLIPPICEKYRGSEYQDGLGKE